MRPCREVWIVLLACLIASSACAAAAPVLILISRSPSDTWAVAELEGMQHVLQSATPPVAAVVEYMDMPGTPRPDYEADLRSYYRSKFAGEHFRVVLAADEPALDFLLKYRDELLPGAQAVFCGITKFDPSNQARRPWLTGVMENMDPVASFRLALALQPDLQRMIVLDDSTRSGFGNKNRIEKELPEVTKRVPLELLRADTAHELFSGIEQLPQGTAVLLTRAQVARRMGPELLARCPVPIYGQRWPTHLGAMLGGAVIDGEQHGAAAAQLGLRLLAGERAADIPAVPGLPARVVVDYAQMRRFRLPFSALPPGTEILNRPRRIWEQYPYATRLAAGSVISLSILAGWLAWALVQKRRRTNELNRSLSLLHATLDSSADGVLVVDRHGKVTGINSRFVELWAIPPALVERRDDDALLTFVAEQLKDPAAFRRRVEELYATPAAESVETIEFKDGRIFDRRSRPQRLDGEIIGRVWTFTDITARCHAEETNRRFEARLAHTQRLEALGTLAGGIAHDFNNLLTAILGYSQLAHDSLEAGNPVRGDLDAVLDASGRARDLVRQILTFSRKSPFERRVIRLDTAVRDAVRLLRATVPAAVDIRSEIPELTANVLADSSQIHQALLNLGTNAAHAMKGRAGAITIRVAELKIEPPLAAELPQLAGSECLCVSVEDAGHGMDADTLRRVFDPFFTTKELGEGTGLGLAVVHGIMHNHDGAVTLESTVGLGTTARLYFPIVPATAEAAPEPSPAPPIPAGKSLLVVDDEPMVLSVAELMLTRLGFKIATATTADGALQIFRDPSRVFDGILTDLNMPHMTGVELAAEIRRSGSEIPIVLASGFIGDAAIEKRAAELGITEVVSKPFTSGGLAAAIHRALAPRHGGRGSVFAASA